MLKLREPLKLHITEQTSKISDSLYDRIVSNYAQISDRIEPEDLLHVVSRPPEVFFAEGDENSIFYNEAQIQNRQEYKTEIINNVVNRILLAPQGRLNYQDNVYVTNVLHKLGIKDEQTFLKSLYQSLEENRQIYHRMSLLEQHTHHLTQTMEEKLAEEGSVTATVTEDQVPTREEVLYLHQQVMNRLKTGEIYREMKSYWNNQLRSEQVTTRQLQMADQVRVSNQIFLQEGKEEQAPANLYYHKENRYEDEITSNQVQEQYLTQNLASAVLYSLIENIYQTRLEKNLTTGSVWQQISRALYRSEENLFQRLQENLYSDAKYLFSQRLSLNELLENMTVLTEQNENYVIAPTMMTLLERVTQSTQEEEESIPPMKMREIVAEEGQEISMENIEEVTRNSFTRQYINQIQEQGKNVSPAILEILQNTISKEESAPEEELLSQPEIPSEEILPPAEITNIQNVTEENILERVEQMRIENERRVREFNEALQNIQQTETVPRNVSPQELQQRTILESRNIIDQPEKVLASLAQDQPKVKSEPAKREEEFLQSLPPEIRSRMEFLYRIANGESIDQTDAQGEEALKELVTQIHEVETEKQERERQILRQERQLKEETARSIEEIQKKTPDTVRKVLSENKEIALVHKVQETINQEEILEQLQEQKRLIRSQKEVREEHHDTVVNTVNQKETRTIVQEEVRNMDLARMVQNSVARELEGLEEQIFNSLEDKLEDERKRRGL